MDWLKIIQNNVTDAEEVRDILDLSQEEYDHLQNETEMFPMSVTKYYLSLIDPDDPEDPIRKMAIPAGRAVILDGKLDTSGEYHNTKIRGLQHKYEQTALILTTSECAMYCRHCFRRRIVGTENDESTGDVNSAVAYIKDHPEISNVLLSGGDAFMMSTEKIEEWLEKLCTLDQLDFIRFGSRTPVTFPQRILKDEKLCEVIDKYSHKKQIYVITHFNHPRELTDESRTAVRMLKKANAVIKNQTVLLKGVNDDPKVMGELLKGLTEMGMTPHYIFQCRPVKGVKSIFQVPLEDGIEIVQKANAMQNGLGKTADYTMSHVTGKIRILGKQSDGKVVLQYKQAKDPSNIGKMFTGHLGDRKWLPDDISECLQPM